VGVGVGGPFALSGAPTHATGRIGKAAVVGSVLRRLALDPRREPVVMVGDRHHDVDGAADYGVPTIGVAWGYAEPGELRGARLMVSDPTELVAVLTGDAIWSAAAASA
jgi:phosphoglycolate phosphatase